ncbi:MAG: CpsD/CapB family tyrosine-protein kinase [Candidatus Kurthia intestinigallinarum]|uniref:CpsD/CapB family tyrosine-protein kinase n=1 Tax=Kurthia sp. Dielmo TaxID=1033738 RepID=UPI001121863D|nr:CpsD/CapB family tyrosine-protein kinase [Kurthia sp. Dielmo]
MKKMTRAARQLIVREQPQAVISEQYRTLRTNIKFSKSDKLKSFLVTSAIQAEGKSTTAANLAYLLAEEGKNVLFIDADLRKPTVHYTFHLKNTVGLSHVLSNQIEVASAIQRTDVTGLSIMTSGPIPPNPSELLGSQRFQTFLAEVEESYDWIIFDTSPLLAVTDTQLLANRLDGTILVVDSMNTDKKMAKKAMNLLKSADAKVLGVVMNNVTASNVNYYSSKYYRSYVND